jgi:dethiobiotin synthetase
MIRLGITGTDTGVGKTVVSCAIAAGLRRRKLRVSGMKPIETGVSFDDPGRDGALIARAAGGTLPLSVLAPITLAEPLAPLAATRHGGGTIDFALLDHAVRTASSQADALIVEGAGGLLVPITDTVAYDTLFARWNLTVVVVAANKLGTINHTRLTIAAARAAGLDVAFVVLNDVAPERANSARDNASLIAELEKVRVVELPWLPDPNDLERASEIILEPVIHALERSR